ncbi:putative ankyrin repeat protein [Cotonvirus japonicus]|uniref:Ankyrin repeat protein n=1 Tax=Cotonvirus japonicus TaxID=2811091 RepID=A0ABM7NTB1_9VIRU|nr:putative ankyrin repeat protein [Cotonvirus japonicus]BCS83415.1 putative ankyrin repeat protein [Cotonvirus japonicus]
MKIKKNQTTKYMTYANVRPNIFHYHYHDPNKYFMEDNDILFDTLILKETNEKFFEIFLEYDIQYKENVLLYLVCNDFDKLKLLHINNKLIDDDLNNILKMAVVNNKYEILQFLIDIGIDLSIDNYFAISCAPCSNNIEMVKLIVDNGQDVTVNNNAAIINSIKFLTEPNLEIINYLIEKGADINAHNNFCIKYAIFSLNFKLFKYLVNVGVDYKIIISYLMKTLLRQGYYTVRGNNIIIKFINYFIGNEVTFEFLSKKDIIFCLRASNKKIIELLIDNGADISFINNYSFGKCQNNTEFLVNKIINLGISPENFILFYFEMY